MFIEYEYCLFGIILFFLYLFFMIRGILNFLQYMSKLSNQKEGAEKELAKGTKILLANPDKRWTYLCMFECRCVHGCTIYVCVFVAEGGGRQILILPRAPKCLEPALYIYIQYIYTRVPQKVRGKYLSFLSLWTNLVFITAACLSSNYLDPHWKRTFICIKQRCDSSLSACPLSSW